MLDPAYNMALGQKYVRHLAGQPMIGDNLLLLLAAYNCGPGKLARWMDERTNDPLLFIESLPARETRDYVQQVLIQYWTYRARLAEPQTSLTQLAHGEWPRTTLRDEVLPLKKRIKKASVITGFEVASIQK
jgi:soluble lytic murein transglycosylase-like protein